MKKEKPAVNFRVTMNRSAWKDWRKLESADKQRVLDILPFLALNPFIGKKLQGEFTGSRRMRVWPFRVVYRILKKERVVEVWRVGHRGSIGY